MSLQDFRPGPGREVVVLDVEDDVPDNDAMSLKGLVTSVRLVSPS